MHDLAALIVTELERWASDPGQGLIRPGAPGGGSYTDSTEFVGPVPVLDEMAKLRMAIGDDEVSSSSRLISAHMNKTYPIVFSFIFIWQSLVLISLLKTLNRSVRSGVGDACTRCWETYASWPGRLKTR